MSHENGIESAGFAIDNYVQDYCYGDIGEKRFAEKVIKAYLDASGMVMVPRDPTSKMLNAAAKALSPGKRPTPDFVSVSKKHLIRYQAMIAAAPNPFQTPEESREKK